MRMWPGIGGGQRAARRDDRLERLAAARAARDPVHDLRRVAAGAARRPGVGLAVQADDVGRALAQHLQRLRAARRPRPEHRVPLAGAAHGARVVQLRVDHRLERAQQPGEPLGRALERPQHVRQRFHRRHAVVGGLAPDAVVAGRGRREPDLRQPRQHRVALEQLARLPPGAVDHHQRDRLPAARPPPDRWRSAPGTAGRRGGPRRRRPSEPASAARTWRSSSKSTPTCSSDPGRHRCASRRGADRHVTFARMLQQQHARARRQRHQVCAVADRLGPPAARADRSMWCGCGNHAGRLASPLHAPPDEDASSAS